VCGQRRGDDVHFVLEALRPERPDRTVDHASGENRPFGRAPLALEEAAGDLARGVHALLDVDCQWEEVRALPCFRLALRGREPHRVAMANVDGDVGLLGLLASIDWYFSDSVFHCMVVLPHVCM